MSTPSITPFVSFRRVRTVEQDIVGENEAAVFRLIPDSRFRPICSGCGEGVVRIHSAYTRSIRDLDLGSHRVLLELEQRRLRCCRCGGTHTEAHEFVGGSARVTKRLARYIADLCRMLSVAEVADHLGLDWKLVKRCDKEVLAKEVGGTDTEGLRLLAVDEIAIKKRHQYMTVVLDWGTGRVVWLGEGRRTETLSEFFEVMSEDERAGIEAVAMDMWKPYMKAVRKCLPNARIVFDLFHVVQRYNQEVLDKVRIAAYRKVESDERRKFIKGSRFILYKNEENLTEKEQPKLEQLLKLNKEIQMAHVLKDSLKQIWTARGPWATRRAIRQWCALADESGITALQKFAKTLRRHARGIVTHGRWRLHTGRLEGVNNKIKVIKRRSYGFHDPEYFALKVKQAFSGSACT